MDTAGKKVKKLFREQIPQVLERLPLLLTMLLYIVEFLSTGIGSILIYRFSSFPCFYWIIALVLFLLSYAITSVFGLSADFRWKKNAPAEQKPDKIEEKAWWKFLVTFFGGGPVLRYMDSFNYHKKLCSNNEHEAKRGDLQEHVPEDLEKLQKYELRTGALIFFMHCILHSCPMAVLQLCHIISPQVPDLDRCLGEKELHCITYNARINALQNTIPCKYIFYKQIKESVVCFLC